MVVSYVKYGPTVRLDGLAQEGDPDVPARLGQCELQTKYNYDATGPVLYRRK